MHIQAVSTGNTGVCSRPQFATAVITIALVVGIFAASMWGFRYIDQSFFPDSTRPQFMLDFWLPEGTHIDETLDQVNRGRRLFE